MLPNEKKVDSRTQSDFSVRFGFDIPKTLDAPCKRTLHVVTRFYFFGFQKGSIEIAESDRSLESSCEAFDAQRTAYKH